MNTSTFARDLTSQMIPLVQLDKLSEIPSYREAFARELLNPDRMEEAFDAAVILDRPGILDRLIAIYGYPNGLDPNNEEWSEDAPVDSEDLIVKVFENNAVKTFAYLYGRFNTSLNDSFNGAVAISLNVILDKILNGELPVEVLNNTFNMILNTDRNLEWHIKDLLDFVIRKRDEVAKDIIETYYKV